MHRFVCSIAVFLERATHQLLGWLLHVVGPAQFLEHVQQHGCEVDLVVAQLSCFVVPGEDMVIVVPALAHGHNRYVDVLTGHDASEQSERGKESRIDYGSQVDYRSRSTHLSYGLEPQRCAALFTDQVKFRLDT